MIVDDYDDIARRMMERHIDMPSKRALKTFLIYATLMETHPVRPESDCGKVLQWLKSLSEGA